MKTVVSTVELTPLHWWLVESCPLYLWPVWVGDQFAHHSRNLWRNPGCEILYKSISRMAVVQSER